MGSPTDTADVYGPPIRVERPFTCTSCGYPTVEETPALQPELRATCVNCGDWTIMMADAESLRQSAAAIADKLAGDVVTERQLLAYLLREMLGNDRQDAATIMECSPSNVDNLHQRCREKITDAKRLVQALDQLEHE